MTSLPFCFFRSAREASPYFRAVSRVTTKASESSAMPYGSTWRPAGRAWVRAFCISPDSVAVTFGAR